MLIWLIMLFFESENFILLKGDCSVLMKNINENSIDMIFADPPYFLSKGGITCYNGKRICVNKGDWDKKDTFEDEISFHTNWLEQCYRILKPNGTIWISGTYHNIYKCGFLMQKFGFHIINEIIWYKPNASPNLSCRCFTASHETLIWARKNKDQKHTFNYKDIKESEFSGDFLKKKGKQMRSVWVIGTPKKQEKKFGKHPTQKPLELLKRIILSSTKPGDILLDPFNGSGTTGIAAFLLDRKYIGIDINEEYLLLTKNRYLDLSYQNYLSKNKS